MNLSYKKLSSSPGEQGSFLVRAISAATPRLIKYTVQAPSESPVHCMIYESHHDSTIGRNFTFGETSCCSLIAFSVNNVVTLLVLRLAISHCEFISRCKIQLTVARNNGWDERKSGGIQAGRYQAWPARLPRRTD